MPVEKVSLSLDAQVVAEARAASGGNLSAYVNEALEARVRNRQLRQVLDDFKDEFRANGRRMRRKTIDQRGVAQDVDGARDAVTCLGNQTACVV